MADEYSATFNSPVFKTFETTVKVISEEQEFKVGKLPGTAITGFVDVEKFITINKHTFFLEKKLPFQILIISAHEEPCDLTFRTPKANNPIIILQIF